MENKNMEKQDNNVDMQAVIAGFTTGIGGAILAIAVYVLVAMMGDYHPVFTFMIYLGAIFGYFFAVDKIKKMKKEKKEEIEGIASKKSKFYTRQFGEEITSLELIIGIIFTIIVSFIGIYMAEVLAFTFYKLKIEKLPTSYFSELFSYAFSNVLQIEGSSSYIIWGWIGTAVFSVFFIIITVIKKIKGENIYEN